jgi:hypothetical protein
MDGPDDGFFARKNAAKLKRQPVQPSLFAMTDERFTEKPRRAKSSVTRLAPRRGQKPRRGKGAT